MSQELKKSVLEEFDDKFHYLGVDKLNIDEWEMIDIRNFLSSAIDKSFEAGRQSTQLTNIEADKIFEAGRQQAIEEVNGKVDNLIEIHRQLNKEILIKSDFHRGAIQVLINLKYKLNSALKEWNDNIKNKQ